MSPRRLRHRAALLVTGLVLSPALIAPASAEPPMDLSGPVTDEAGVLTDGDRERVDEALDAYYDETQRQLFVVYVDSFEGLDGAEWADETARESGLGSVDVLMAVATQQRAYGFSAPEDISDADLERVDREFVLPTLRRSAWADAAVAAAEGFTDIEQGVDVPWGPVAVGGAAALAAGGYAIFRARRRYDHTHHVRDEHGNPIDPADILTDEELEQNATTALLNADDALTTFEQEIGFAEAQFGPEAVTSYREVLEQERARTREAFALRQRLDDAQPESDDDRRHMTSRITGLCEQVDTTLATQLAELDRLRDLQTNAPAALESVGERVAATHRRLDASRATLQELRSAHQPSVVAPVVGNVGEAESLLRAAHEATGNAQAELATSTADAAVHLATAESAVAQAGTLLDAIDSLAGSLAAEQKASDDLAGRVAARAGAVSTFVETHRLAVGTHARTRLAEARRLLQSSSAPDAEGSGTVTADLERAERLVEEAQQSAEADVATWRAQQDRPQGRDASTLESLALGGVLLGRGRRRSPVRRAPRVSRSTWTSTSSGSSRGSTTRRTRSSGTTRRSRGGSTRRSRSRGGRF